jgi:hypothetical protein
VRLVGSADPDFHVHVIRNLTGLVLHQLAVPDPHFDPTEELVSLLEALVGAGARGSRRARRPAPLSSTTALLRVCLRDAASTTFCATGQRAQGPRRHRYSV